MDLHLVCLSTNKLVAHGWQMSVTKPDTDRTIAQRLPALMQDRKLTPASGVPLGWALEYHTVILFSMKYKFILFLPGYLKAQLVTLIQLAQRGPEPL